MIKKIVKRILGCQTTETPTQPQFSPYEKELDVEGARGRFFFGTPQAREWYHPLKPYAKLEYDWVVQNVPLKGERIIDGGSHHGQYSVVFHVAAEGECELVSVDPNPMNCLLTEVNLRLNGADASRIVRAAISDHKGRLHFSEESNGRILKDGGIEVDAFPLNQILPDATVVKLDIEGAEYTVFPDALSTMPNVHTWIIEMHPMDNPHPDTILEPFLESGFTLHYVDRDSNKVIPYILGTEWKIHSTVFAVRGS